MLNRKDILHDNEGEYVECAECGEQEPYYHSRFHQRFDYYDPPDKVMCRKCYLKWAMTHCIECGEECEFENGADVCDICLRTHIIDEDMRYDAIR